MNASAASTSPVEQDARRLREHQVSKFEVGLSARRSQQVIFAELGRQDRKEVAFHLVVSVESVAACLLVFLYLSLKFCDPRGYVLQVLHGARVQHSDFAAQLLEAQRQAAVDDPYHAPPGIEAV